MNIVNGLDMDDPLFQYSIEEMRQMTDEEYCSLLEQHGEYVRKKHNLLKEEKIPQFNTIEEIREYYHCRPFDEAMGEIYKLFDNQ